jgi:hypothetical protein
VILIEFCCQRGRESLLCQSQNYGDHWPARGHGLDLIADPQRMRRLGIAPAHFDVAAGASFLRKRPGFEETSGPEPFVDAYSVHGGSNSSIGLIF